MTDTHAADAMLYRMHADTLCVLATLKRGARDKTWRFDVKEAARFLMKTERELEAGGLRDMFGPGKDW